MANEQPKLGMFPTIADGRDAVHVPIAPTVAGTYLRRGDWVEMGDDGRAYPAVSKPVGIVDPFLDTEKIQKGEMFWLCVKPGTIQSLRHVWVHEGMKRGIR